MLPTDSVFVNTPHSEISYDSLKPSSKIPLLEAINEQSWDDKIEKQLKESLFFKHSVKVENDVDTDSSSFFISHQSTFIKNEEIVREKTVDWFFLSFLLLLTLLSMVKLQSIKVFSFSLKSIVNTKFSAALSREGNFFRTRSFIFILLFLCLGIGVLLYAFFGTYFPIESQILKITYAVLLFSLFFFTKIFIISFTGVLLKMKTITIEYIQQLVLANYYMAVFILPFAFAYHYFPACVHLLYISGGLFFLIFLYKIIKGFFLFKSNFYLYENFLYFCTIEILPILLVVKYAISYL